MYCVFSPVGINVFLSDGTCVSQVIIGLFLIVIPWFDSANIPEMKVLMALCNGKVMK
jgi:hypothetical protein